MIHKTDLEITSLNQLKMQQQLVGVGGNLIIDIDQKFCLEDQFPCLEFVSGNIILDNTMVVQINDFHRLTRVGRDIIIEDNDKLVYINGFECLEFVKNLKFCGNSILEHIYGFGNLTTVGCDLNIVSNLKLCQIPEFEKLTKIKNDLRIVSNASLECIDAFHNLLVANTIGIIANPSLIKISGFESLIAIQEIKIIENGLKCLPNFESLKWLGQQYLSPASLIIEQNHRLSEIPSEFMPCLLLSIGNIHIVNNSKLRSISGFQKLAISRIFLIQENCNLVEICGFDSLETTENLDISDNKRLHRICGFNNLVSIISMFKISPSVQSICGFKRLIAVDGELYPDGQMSVWLRGVKYIDVPSFLIAVQKQCGCHC
jgi:hypothetical protein